MLDVRGVTVRFGSTTVLDHVSLSVARAEVVALVGPSGSGKSTLLRVIAGLHEPDDGSVSCDGELLDGVAAHRRQFGFVFQDDQLFPHRDVAGNVAFGLRMMGASKATTTRRVTELLDLVRLPGFERRRVADLSGGEAKRVALARALAPAPRLLLLDEPLTGLDGELHDQLAVDLRQVLTQTGTTAIIVTHDLAEARTVADRIVEIGHLSAGAAIRLVDLDPPDTYDLRRRILRDGTATSDVTYAEDDMPGTVHIGALLGGRLVATSTWAVEPWPEEPATPAVRIRGMAVEPDLQGGGCGFALVEEGVRRAAALPVSLVWATARDTVLGFYERCGFEVTGAGFVDEATALAHHTVIRRL